MCKVIRRAGFIYKWSIKCCFSLNKLALCFNSLSPQCMLGKTEAVDDRWMGADIECMTVPVTESWSHMQNQHRAVTLSHFFTLGFSGDLTRLNPTAMISALYSWLLAISWWTKSYLCLFYGTKLNLAWFTFSIFAAVNLHLRLLHLAF